MRNAGTKWLATLGLLLIPMIAVEAQTGRSYDEFVRSKNRAYERYVDERNRQYEEARRKRNEQFAESLREPWTPVTTEATVVIPKEDDVPPWVVKPQDKLKRTPVSRRIIFDRVFRSPKAVPQPQPATPIEELPPSSVSPRVLFQFFGTAASVRFDRKDIVRLATLNENGIADAWKELSKRAYTNLLRDCLDLRKQYALCDWAYLQMLVSMSEAVCGKGTSEAVLLMAYVYSQSGYKMRLSIGEGRLYMLFASKHRIYSFGNYYRIDGDFFYFTSGLDTPDNIRLCWQEYPQEKTLSLGISSVPKFAVNVTGMADHISSMFTDMFVSIAANRNMLDFYTSYPTSDIGGDIGSRWALYANMPMPEHVQAQVYPRLRSAIRDCDQLTAVNKLLNFVQTGFVYEYDTKVWGEDRVFFPEETLHYPYCDCEDRSILLTRLVRDLLGLRCVLVYYPGHLASAVEITQGNPVGDYLEVDNRRFFITDGTITGMGAPLGHTMSGMDNKTAKVIMLE